MQNLGKFLSAGFKDVATGSYNVVSDTLDDLGVNKKYNDSLTGAFFGASGVIAAAGIILPFLLPTFVYSLKVLEAVYKSDEEAISKLAPRTRNVPEKPTTPTV
jgi:hypothetical protein